MSEETLKNLIRQKVETYLVKSICFPDVVEAVVEYLFDVVKADPHQYALLT